MLFSLTNKSRYHGSVPIPAALILATRHPHHEVTMTALYTVCGTDVYHVIPIAIKYMLHDILTVVNPYNKALTVKKNHLVYNSHVNVINLLLL